MLLASVASVNESRYHVILMTSVQFTLRGGPGNEVLFVVMHFN